MKQTIFLFALIINFIQSFAQTAIPTLEAGDIISVGLPLSSISQACDIYMTKDTDGEKLKLIHTPYFAFETNKEGKIKIETNKLSATQSEIVLTLLCSPVELKKSIADYISSLAVRNGNNELKKINESDIITPLFLSLTITDAISESDLPFNANTETHNYSPTFIKLRSNPIKAKDIQNYIDEIQNGLRQLRFKISYDLNAKFTTSSSQLVANIANIKDTRAFQQLEGNASAFTWSANYSAGSITKNATTLTRQQKNSFEGSLRQELTVIYDIQKAGDLQFLQTQLDNFLKDVFISVKVNIDDNFTKEIARLSQYDIGLQRDIQPDEINSFISKIKDYLNDETKNDLDIDLKTKGSGLFGLLSADLDTKYTKNEFVKKLRDNGWDIEQKGNIFIPKSIELYSINEAKLLQSSSIKIKMNQSKQDLLKQEFQISTSENHYYPEKNEFSTFYNSFISNSCPIGTILPFGGNTDKIPNGWRLCNGASLAKNGNEELFNIIGYNWGKQPNEDFNLPDLRGVFLRGVDNEKDLDKDRRQSGSKGLIVNDYQDDALQQHTHKYNTGGWYDNGEKGKGIGYVGVNWDKSSDSKGPDISKTSSNETRPKNVAVNYIIRCK